MATYSRRTRIDAPLSEVWDFHSRVSGLKTLTPEWTNLRIEAVRGPEGESDPEILEQGSQIRMSARPFGVGPRRRWTSRIVAREEGDGSAMFRDDMVGGPFESWVHTHRFFADGGGTILEDEVEYELPCGPLGRAATPFASVGFEPMFRERHRRARAVLE
ncbi:SRPBCC family protein [Halopelagius fulvigenes]|uniref:SRPBCC family protein n=1 Tax=Halopelagius fulvigenes TaxID=1198324 RepID=A0ABD5TXK3_9EURY